MPKEGLMRRSHRLVPAAALAATLLAGATLAGCSSGGGPTPAPSGSSASPSPSSAPGSSAPTPPPSASPTTPYPDPAKASGKAVSLYDFLEFWGDNTAGMEADFSELEAAGTTWARLRLASSPAAADRFATVVAAAARHHIQLIVILEKPAPLLDLGTPADQQAYRTWVAQIVGRYRASVHYWEILSEPNLRYTWNIDSKHDSDQQAYLAAVERYVTLLKQGYETVKATDPTATVLFGGLSEAKVERYLRAVMTTDAARYFDIMDFHAYGQTPDSVLSRYRSFRRSMQSNPAWAAKPIWVEFGFNSSWSDKGGYSRTEGQKARNFVKATKLVTAAGAQGPIFWFTLHGNNPDSPGYGLITRDKQDLSRRRLKAFYALQDMPAPGPGTGVTATSTSP
jgi:hypothetical protein